VLVARTGHSSFAALSAICPHRGCTITGHSRETYICPCHGSRFDTDGQVVGGPAVTPLRKYQAHFADDTLIIALS
jgi:cytochrome b6-f complex iron-sulfur subunit